MSEKRILIVDDSADSRYSLSLFLDGYEVIEAGGGAEAVELARGRRPHCILLDVQMPGMDGFEVCRQLRAGDQTRTIPIILVTGHHRDTDSLVRGLAAGGDDYITKPVTRQELRARVDAMLRIQHLQSRLEALNEDLENQVRRRTSELHQIYTTVPIGLYTLDAEGRVTSFNGYLEELLGYREEDVVGKRHVDELFDDEYDARYWLDLCRKEGRAACEATARRRDGALVPVFDERVVMVDHRGEHVGFTAYMQDMRRRQRLRRLMKEQENQAGVGRLAGMIVHEIANPISGVSHYLDAVLTRLGRNETIAGEELRRGAEVMRDALNRTTDLIRRLRGMTRSAVHRVPGVDPFGVLEDLRALLRHDLHRRGIVMRLAGERDHHTVRGDLGQLSQVFLNLIMNARDAMPDGGEITVAIRAVDGSVELAFKDTGVGIAPENLERVFEFLYTTKGEQGTGYGLSISKDIVAEHGGRITVESELGSGSTITVILPLDAPR